MANTTLSDILNEVSKQTTITASAVSLLQQLFALKDDPTKLSQVMTSLLANDQALAAAITANTPVATPTPAPAAA